MNAPFTPLSKSKIASLFSEQILLSRPRKSLYLFLTKNKSILFAFTILLFIFLLALIGPYLHSYTYYDTNLPMKNLPPSMDHWFGTDELGRDLFTRTAFGARISLTIGICAALIDLFVGILWGMMAAFFGGKIDEILMRICDILASLPYLLTVILLMVVMGQGMLTILIALTFTGWINMARIIRAHVLQLKNKEFILAAIAMGASNSRLLFRHLIPATFASILATVTLTIPLAIYTEAFLSFLGLGIQAPIASWGAMVNDGITALRFYPWRLFFPALMIFFTMLGFNLLGDHASDTFDPRIKS